MRLIIRNLFISFVLLIILLQNTRAQTVPRYAVSDTLRLQETGYNYFKYGKSHSISSKIVFGGIGGFLGLAVGAGIDKKEHNNDFSAKGF